MNFKEYYDYEINGLVVIPTHLYLMERTLLTEQPEVSAEPVVAPLAKPTPQEIARQQQAQKKPPVDEIQANTLLRNTEPNRTYRGNYEIKRGKTWYNKTEENLDYLSYNVLADPSTQQKHHYGYIIWNNTVQTKPVREVYCDCSDFQFRLYYPFVQKGLAQWNVGKKFASNTTVTRFSPDGRVLQIPFKHNQTAGTKGYNASPNHLFVCKHLYNVIKGYIVGIPKDSPIPESFRYIDSFII